MRSGRALLTAVSCPREPADTGAASLGEMLTREVNNSYAPFMETRPLSELLRELREERGASLRGAARDLGVDPSYLSRLERGEKPASPELLRRAAEYYEVPEEGLALAEGKLPTDVIDILRAHPDLIERIRSEYGSK